MPQEGFATKEMQERLRKIREHALSIASLSQNADQEPLEKIGSLMDFIGSDVEAIRIYSNGVRLELELKGYL